MSGTGKRWMAAGMGRSGSRTGCTGCSRKHGVALHTQSRGSWLRAGRCDAMRCETRRWISLSIGGRCAGRLDAPFSHRLCFRFPSLPGDADERPPPSPPPPPPAFSCANLLLLLLAVCAALILLLYPGTFCRSMAGSVIGRGTLGPPLACRCTVASPPSCKGSESTMCASLACMAV